MQQLGGGDVTVVGICYGQSHAGPDDQLLAVDGERPVQGLGHLLVDHLQVVVPSLDEYCEFVTANPRHRIAGVDSSQDPFANKHEQFVANVIAEGFVHHVEVVDVEADHRDCAPVAVSHLHRMTHPVVEDRSVGQPGQVVTEGLVGDGREQPGVLADNDELPSQEGDNQQRTGDCGRARQVVVVRELPQPTRPISATGSTRSRRRWFLTPEHLDQLL
nr:hypothetical protein [Mycobacterium sp. DL592]